MFATDEVRNLKDDPLRALQSEAVCPAASIWSVQVNESQLSKNSCWEIAVYIVKGYLSESYKDFGESGAEIAKFESFMLYFREFARIIQ